MSGRRGRLALAAALLLAGGLVLAVGFAVARRRSPPLLQPVLEWTPRFPGKVFVDDEAVYAGSPGRMQVHSLATPGAERTAKLAFAEPLGLYGGALVARQTYTRLELDSLATGASERGFEIEPFRSATISTAAGVVALSSEVPISASRTRVTIQLHSLADGALVGTRTGEIAAPFFESLPPFFSQDGSLVAVTVSRHQRAPADETRVWSTRGPLTSLLPHAAVGLTSTGEVEVVEGRALVLYGPDGEVRRRLELGGTIVSKFAESGRVVVSRKLGAETELEVVDPSVGERLARVRLPASEDALDVKLSPSGRVLGVAASGTIKVWELDR